VAYRFGLMFTGHEDALKQLHEFVSLDIIEDQRVDLRSTFMFNEVCRGWYARAEAAHLFVQSLHIMHAEGLCKVLIAWWNDVRVRES
jgi:hypothetical protein